MSLLDRLIESSHSPDGRFTLRWADAHPTEPIAGHRDSGDGQFALLDGPRLLAEGSLARPNNGRVANDGTFVLNDWGFGDGLQGTFCAFRQDGSQILARRFDANLFNCGISFDGRYAVCQTCNAPRSSDGSVLIVFDLQQEAEIARFKPESGWADEYEFAADARLLLKYRKLGAFAYGLDGRFLDKEAWRRAVLAQADTGASLNVIGNVIKTQETSPALISEMEQCLTSILERERDGRPRATALKYRGILFESGGEPARALDCFEEALSIDPGIGVKSRANKLSKGLGRALRLDHQREVSKGVTSREVSLKKMSQPASWELDFHVAGVSFEGRQGTIRARSAELEAGSALLLVREPSNPVDQNAIKVCLPDGVCLGWVPRGRVTRDSTLTQQELAGFLDGGSRYELHCWGVPGLTNNMPTLGVGANGRLWAPQAATDPTSQLVAASPRPPIVGRSTRWETTSGRSTGTAVKPSRSRSVAWLIGLVFFFVLHRLQGLLNAVVRWRNPSSDKSGDGIDR